MKKVITFLGTKRQATQYSLGNQIYTGDVFAQALRQFLEFDQMLVFVTARARSEVYPVLEALGDDRIIPVDIPIGENADEMWEIFEKLTSQIDDGDEVSFDITHGLRSIPFLVFLAAAFLKSAKQVTIEGIYYGASELRQDSEGNSRPAPIIDLSEFVTLLDWLNASEQFREFGNASELARQLRQAGTEPSLGNAAKALEKVSRSLRLILPDQAMEASYELERSLEDAAEAIKQSARPFSVLSKQVTNSYAPLALPNPRGKKSLINGLQIERQMIQWYLDRNLVIQAVAVAREWLISWGALYAGHTSIYDWKKTREPVENAFNEAARGTASLGLEYRKANGEFIFENHCLSTGEASHKLFSELGDVRNTLLHAGKNLNERSAVELERRARKLCKLIEELPLPSGSEKSR